MAAADLGEGELAKELAEGGIVLATERADRRPPIRQQVEVCLAALERVFGMDGTLAKTLTALAIRISSGESGGLHLRLLYKPDARSSSKAHQGSVGMKTSQHLSSLLTLTRF